MAQRQRSRGASRSGNSATKLCSSDSNYWGRRPLQNFQNTASSAANVDAPFRARGLSGSGKARYSIMDLYELSLSLRLPSPVTLQPSYNLLPSSTNTLLEMYLSLGTLGRFAESFQRNVSSPHGGVSEKRDWSREWSRRGRCKRSWVTGCYLGL